MISYDNMALIMGDIILFAGIVALPFIPVLLLIVFNLNKRVKILESKKVTL